MSRWQVVAGGVPWLGGTGSVSFEELVDGAVRVSFDLAVVADGVDVEIVVNTELSRAERLEMLLVTGVLVTDVGTCCKRCSFVATASCSDAKASQPSTACSNSAR